MPVVRRFREELFGRFAGCIDCNSKMTIANFVARSFDLVFPNGTYAVGAHPAGGRHKPANTEEMIHYLMLSGCLKSGDLAADRQTFSVQGDPFRLQSWTLKYITMWCVMQILFCKWHMGDEGPVLWHHMDYLYVGVMDFYMSVWFYALHCLGFVEGSRHPVSFMEFHYFYCSLMPQFLKSVGAWAGDPMNLSLTTMHTDDLSNYRDAWKFPNRDRATDLETMQRQAGDIMNDMKRMWTNHIQRLSDQINAGRGLQGPHAGFFIDPPNIKNKRDGAVGAANAKAMSIASFSALLGRQWYWLHFKTITQRRITLLARDYDAHLSQNHGTLAADTRVQLWRQWYRRFAALGNAL
jgi:hypothetical protein